MANKITLGYSQSVVERAVRKLGYLIAKKGYTYDEALEKASAEYGVDKRLMTYGNR